MRLVSLTQYKDRAEERRRAVGSTAITNPKPAAQPVVTVPTGEVVPGYSAPRPIAKAPAQETAPVPSIGQMLLAKEGWLKKEEEPEVTGMVGNRRGGLGYDDKAATMRSEIIRKTLDHLNKF